MVRKYRIKTFKAVGYNQYPFTFDQVYAHQLATPIEFTVMNNGTAISNTYRFDVESYAAQSFESDPAEDQAMVAAMVKYGRAKLRLTPPDPVNQFHSTTKTTGASDPVVFT